VVGGHGETHTRSIAILIDRSPSYHRLRRVPRPGFPNEGPGRDLHSVWEERGVQALEKCAAEEPGVFIRVCASLMPKDLNLSVDVAVNATDFVARFRTAQEMLGNEPPRRPMRVINAR
jgi:hypothetical protein